MRKLLALLILSIALMIGGTDFASAEKNWGVAPVMGTQTMGGSNGLISTQSEITAVAEEVCIGPTALLDFYRSPPGPLPDTEMLMILEGGTAQAFVIRTGGVQLVEFVGAVFILHAPESHPGRVAAVLADAAGCIILASGKRTDTPRARAERAFDRGFVEELLKDLDPQQIPLV